VGFAVAGAALGQDLCEHFDFPDNHSIEQLLHNHHHHLSSRASTIGQQMASLLKEFAPLQPKGFTREIIPVFAHEIMGAVIHIEAVVYRKKPKSVFQRLPVIYIYCSEFEVKNIDYPM
jgi:hypothetical protein